ncbi:MAG: hypothetical protein ACM3JB_26065 [Acidobacteriaceae bacterium]
MDQALKALTSVGGPGTTGGRRGRNKEKGTNHVSSGAQTHCGTAARPVGVNKAFEVRYRYSRQEVLGHTVDN